MKLKPKFRTLARDEHRDDRVADESFGDAPQK